MTWGSPVILVGRHSCTHQTRTWVLHALIIPCHGLITVGAAVQSSPRPMVVPHAKALLEVYPSQLPWPAPADPAGVPPVRTQPASWLGGPSPESAWVSPRAVSYCKLLVSRISQREAMWNPLAQAVGA